MLENLIIAHYHICNKNFAHECIVICRVSEHNNAWNRKLCNKEIDPQSALLNWSIFPVSGKWGDFVNQYYYFFFFTHQILICIIKFKKQRKSTLYTPLGKCNAESQKMLLYVGLSSDYAWNDLKLLLWASETSLCSFWNSPYNTIFEGFL